MVKKKDKKKKKQEKFLEKSLGEAHTSVRLSRICKELEKRRLEVGDVSFSHGGYAKPSGLEKKKKRKGEK